MLHQEEACYITVNYMDPAYQKGLIQALQCPPAALDNSNSSSSSGSSSSSSKSTINEFWREKIVEWCYQVVDHFDFSREVVSVAIHYLDRYLATKYVNKKMFQLAAMVSLYLAIKLHDPRRLSMAAMIELSRGCFVMEQMKAMEMELLRCVASVSRQLLLLGPPMFSQQRERLSFLLSLCFTVASSVVRPHCTKSCTLSSLRFYRVLLR